MPDRTSHGATNRSRTDDLILTKDVLYQLSHSSLFAAKSIIAKFFRLVNINFDAFLYIHWFFCYNERNYSKFYICEFIRKFSENTEITMEKTKKTIIQKPRGTMDILPEDMPIWLHIENAARAVCKRYGFHEIRFPTFEATELFARGVGDTSDVVQKEMYTFEDREHRSFSLRPEGTAGIVRSIIENGKCYDAMPLKLAYLINCFRYEKPQAGRSREFYQFGIEMFGAESPSADAMVLALAHDFLKTIGITNAVLHINSIGCKNCRPQYHSALRSYLEAHRDELCDTCRERLEKNPMRILDCKSPVCKAIAAEAPKSIQHLCNDCQTHMDALCNELNQMNIPYVIDTGIVRGLDYYTRTVFEFIVPSIGAQSTILGGGRYDGLVSQRGGPSLAGIGFAAGITRLIEAMKQSGVQIDTSDDHPAVYLASMGQSAETFAAVTAQKLRHAGIRAESDICSRSLKAQMKYADKIGASYIIVIGDNELQSDCAVLKNMQSGEQENIILSQPESWIEKLS